MVYRLVGHGHSFGLIIKIKGVKLKLDISKQIIDYDGMPIIDAGQPLTIRILLRMYAGSYVPQPGEKAAEQSVIANAVALKIHHASNGEVNLTDEEFVILKETIAIPRHAALVYAQVYAAVSIDKQ